MFESHWKNGSDSNFHDERGKWRHRTRLRPMDVAFPGSQKSMAGGFRLNVLGGIQDSYFFWTSIYLHHEVSTFCTCQYLENCAPPPHPRTASKIRPLSKLLSLPKTRLSCDEKDVYSLQRNRASLCLYSRNVNIISNSRLAFTNWVSKLKLKLKVMLQTNWRWCGLRDKLWTFLQ